MSQTAWRAGDTCQIKPDSRHGIGKADCGRLWTIGAMDEKEALVHNGPPGVPDFQQAPGWTCTSWVPLSCLLPAGKALPTMAAKMGAEVLRLRTRVAELEAAQRWRVTAEVSPHEGDRVLGLRGGDPEVMTYAEEGLDHPYLWFTANDSGVDAPEYWMPIPEVSIRKPGAP